MLRWPNSFARWRLARLALPWLLACAQDSQLGYYWQGLRGHLALMQAARPLPAWIAATTPPGGAARAAGAGAARPRLRRGHAAPARQRQLPPLRRPGPPCRRVERGGGAARCTDAAPLVLSTHGRIGYRGYFTEAGAGPGARAAQGLEGWWYGVPAYSTLGCLNWLAATRCCPPSCTGPMGDFRAPDVP